MNLIEQLGGYARAKNHRDYLIDFGNEFNRPNKYEVNKINNALLEYRRQHNVFEEGDICKLKIKHDFGLYKFRRTEGDRVYLEDRLGFAEFGINKGVVEHATDEEIKAGKRLEVK